MTNKIKTPMIAIFGDPNKTSVKKAIAEFKDFAAAKINIIGEYNVLNNDQLKTSCDYAIVFGGDGAIISAARSLKTTNTAVIGVNIGKLGFLAEFSISELKASFDQIINHELPIENRMTLSCKIFNDGKEKFSSTAINDVFVTSGPPFRMIELQMFIDAEPVTSSISDGLIVSTPTGSTAYNLSAGGPILSQKLTAMVITTICPHSLSFRPIVVDSTRKIEIIGLRVNKATTLSVDGQVSVQLCAKDVVKIQREKHDFLIVNNPMRTQWDTLGDKLKWAEKPKYDK